MSTQTIKNNSKTGKQRAQPMENNLMNYEIVLTHN